MGKFKQYITGGIRQKIFFMMILSFLLLIAVYTVFFFYQTNLVEQIVGEAYAAQEEFYLESGLGEDAYEQLQSEAMSAFREKMFHVKNVLILLIVFIVAAGLVAAYFITGRIVKPLKIMTRRVASLGVRNRQFRMENAYRTGDEIEVLAESFAKQSLRTTLYIDQIKRVTAEKERLGAELSLASRIQASQLPRLFPPFPDRQEFDLYASMTPAKAVGGDFYDFFLIDSDHIGLVMADVSGKGVPAALLMMVARVLIKSGLQNGKSPAEVLESVNNQLCEGNEESFFVTVWLAVVEISTGRGVAANAGHEHPALYRAGESYELDVYRHGMPIGTMEGLRFRQHEFQLHPGDSIFVYTDGVAEATSSAQELFGTERMLEALNADPDARPMQTLQNVMDSITRFVDGAEQFDDITMLCFRYLGPGKNGGQQASADRSAET